MPCRTATHPGPQRILREKGQDWGCEDGHIDLMASNKLAVKSTIKISIAFFFNQHFVIHWLYLLSLSIPRAINIPRQDAPRLMLVEWFDKLRLLFEKYFPSKQ